MRLQMSKPSVDIAVDHASCNILGLFCSKQDCKSFGVHVGGSEKSLFLSMTWMSFLVDIVYKQYAVYTNGEK